MFRSCWWREEAIQFQMRVVTRMAMLAKRLCDPWWLWHVFRLNKRNYQCVDSVIKPHTREQSQVIPAARHCGAPKFVPTSKFSLSCLSVGDVIRSGTLEVPFSKTVFVAKRHLGFHAQNSPHRKIDPTLQPCHAADDKKALSHFCLTITAIMDDVSAVIISYC